ncbi:hypothetical protein AT245_07670 [Bartonella henselae]|nr:hypothetical protein AT245_07670 [Bartonella henselae]
MREKKTWQVFLDGLLSVQSHFETNCALWLANCLLAPLCRFLHASNYKISFLANAFVLVLA